MYKIILLLIVITLTSCSVNKPITKTHFEVMNESVVDGFGYNENMFLLNEAN